MTNVINFEDIKKAKQALKEENTPHMVSQLICLACFDRWIGLYPEQALLHEMICKCGVKGKIINTGQNLEAKGCNK